MTLESHAKFEENLTCGLENDMINLANFQQNTLECQNWDFSGILSFQSRKCIRKKYTEKLCVITLKNDEKF